MQEVRNEWIKEKESLQQGNQSLQTIITSLKQCNDGNRDVSEMEKHRDGQHPKTLGGMQESLSSEQVHDDTRKVSPDREGTTPTKLCSNNTSDTTKVEKQIVATLSRTEMNYLHKIAEQLRKEAAGAVLLRIITDVGDKRHNPLVELEILGELSLILVRQLYMLKACTSVRRRHVPSSTEKMYADIGQYIAGQSKSMQTGELNCDLESSIRPESTMRTTPETKVGESNQSQGSSSKKTNSSKKEKIKGIHEMVTTPSAETSTTKRRHSSTSSHTSSAKRARSKKKEKEKTNRSSSDRNIQNSYKKLFQQETSETRENPSSLDHVRNNLFLEGK